MKYTRQVSNNASETQQTEHLPDSAVTPSLTSTDAAVLAELVRNWPMLDGATKQAILAIVRASEI